MKLVSSLLRSQIKLLVKPILKRMDIESERKNQDALGKLGARALKEKVAYMLKAFENFEASWAIPVSPNKTSAILYLHGGAYTAGTLDYAQGFGGILADTTQRNTLCVAYRLAPENPFPAALEDAYQAYLHMLTLYQAENIVFAGESAGGGLCFALALYCRDKGTPLPKCIIALSPWTDLTLSGASYHDNEEKDPSLFYESLAYSADLYAKDNLENPYVSPIFADLTGLPATMMLAGTDELLADDARDMAKRLQEYGVPCVCHLEPGMWHVYVLYGTSEAKEALEQIAEYIDNLTGSKKDNIDGFEEK